MRGNSHARFLGEGAAATSLLYPTFVDAKRDGKRAGFLPPPHTVAGLVAEFMAQVLFIGQENERDTRPLATRLLTVCDSCVGTERLLLHASNFSLRLCGVDLDAMLCLCLATLVNGFVLAPWLVKPLPFLDGLQYQPKSSGALSEAMAS